MRKSFFALVCAFGFFLYSPLVMARVDIPPLAAKTGPTLTVDNNTLNATNPNRLVTGTTDSINCSSDAGSLITYNSVSPVAISIPAATAAGCGYGFGFTVHNKGPGTATFTPSTSTINGTTSLVVPTGTGCAVLSDGSNFNVALCTALGLNGIVTNINTQAASYTAALADSTSMIRMNCSTACNLTIPPNASVAFPVSTVITWEQLGTGALTLVAGDGVTINRLSTLVSVGQYAVGSLVQTSANTWVAFGALQ